VLIHEPEPVQVGAGTAPGAVGPASAPARKDHLGQNQIALSFIITTRQHHVMTQASRIRQLACKVAKQTTSGVRSCIFHLLYCFSSSVTSNKLLYHHRLFLNIKPNLWQSEKMWLTKNLGSKHNRVLYSSKKK
jgi:hypothetical protein